MGGPRVETRISLVLYGGVSLAVYISGACQELLSLVRATADPEVVPDDQLTRAERVYRELAREAGPGGTPMRVTVDVISGSSAGGLNAVFLGKALSHGGSLDGLTEIWRAEADFLRLLNQADPPKSVLDGDKFYLLLRGALDEMVGVGDRRKGLVPAVDCYLTTTDLRGVAEDVRLHDTSIQELRRRARFHFRDGLSSAIGTYRTDLSAENNDVLAFAARATAAHPAAFHPANWGQVNSLAPERAARDVELAKFLSPAYGTEGAVNVEQRWYSDGGAMDNKPFAYALEPLTARRADIPVDRRVVYVEPDPSRSTGNWQDPRLPSLISYTAGTYSLARTENIREDIAVLNARNEEISRLHDSLAALFTRTDDEVRSALRARIGPSETGDGSTSTDDSTDDSVDDVSDADTAVPTEPESDEDLIVRGLRSNYDRESTTAEGVVGSWTTTSRADFAGDRGWGAVAQEEYRWSTVVVDLVRSSLQAGALPPDPALVRRLSSQVKSRLEDWVQARYPGAENVARIGLFVFDLGFRLRRFSLLEHLISHHQRELNSSTGDDVEERFERYAAMRRDINRLYLELITFAEGQRAADFGLHDPEVLGDLTLEEWIETDQFLDVLDDVADRLATPMRAASEDGRQAILAADIDNSMRLRLADGWLNYGDYDQLILPLADIAAAELDSADVIRISPLDAQGLVAEGEESPRKLGGNALAHFGGFLDENWRLNDILWGRLDTAEVAVAKILGIEDPAATRRVHRALLADLAAALRDDPTRPSSLQAILRVNDRADSDRHRRAKAAVETLHAPAAKAAVATDDGSRPGGAVSDPVQAVVDAFVDLLAPVDDPPDRWSVDLRTGGERGKTKITLFESGASVVGEMLARQSEDPFTGGARDVGEMLAHQPQDPPTGGDRNVAAKKTTKSWMAFAGRMISFAVRRALPTRGATVVRWTVAGLLTLAGIAGLAGVGFVRPWGWLTLVLVSGGLLIGVVLMISSLRRVTPVATWIVIVVASVVTAMLVVALVANWLATGASVLFLLLLATGYAFWKVLSLIRKTLMDLGNPQREGVATARETAGPVRR